jgi:hypothetical protein
MGSKHGVYKGHINFKEHTKLSSKDLKALEQQTGLSKAQIEKVFQKMANNPGYSVII